MKNSIALALSMVCISVLVGGAVNSALSYDEDLNVGYVTPIYVNFDNSVSECSKPVEEPKKIIEDKRLISDCTLYGDSFDYIARCVEAEAGNQSELGKRLVCDVILNRYDRGGYTDYIDVIDEVVNGVYQFSVVRNGSINTVEPTDSTYMLVIDEIKNRTNSEVLYFRANRYHSFGEPVLQEGDHYFSK